jgi:kexin
MKPVTALALLAVAAFPTIATPSARTYDTHHYFSLETEPSASVESASHLATTLGVQLVERIGELDGHWLVRCDKQGEAGNVKRDTEQGYLDVIERWKGMKRKRSADVGTIKDVRHLPVRKRAKRQWHEPVPSNGTWLPRDSLEELTYAQSTLSLADPLLPKQWHLINTVMPDIELNVTGLWGQDVNGKGVKVAIIDDGLDMHSDDLAENFASPGRNSRNVC